jgi:hypothetical protein
MDLIRQVLIALEGGQPSAGISGYTEDQIKYHQALAIEAGLAEGRVIRVQSAITDVPGAVVLSRLTWAGHDFLSAIREETKWRQVKVFLAEAGKVLSIETIKAAAKHLFGM